MLCSSLRLSCVEPTALWNTNTLTHGVAVGNVRIEAERRRCDTIAQKRRVSKDPDNLSPAIRMQGVLCKLRLRLKSERGRPDDDALPR